MVGRVSLPIVGLCWECFRARLDMKGEKQKFVGVSKVVGHACEGMAIAGIVKEKAESVVCCICMGEGETRDYRPLMRLVQKRVCKDCDGTGKIVKHGIKRTGDSPWGR